MILLEALIYYFLCLYFGGLYSLILVLTIVPYVSGFIWRSDGVVGLGEDTSCIAMSTDSLLDQV